MEKLQGNNTRFCLLKGGLVDMQKFCFHKENQTFYDLTIF